MSIDEPIGEDDPIADEQIEQLKLCAVNDVTREIARDGISITHEIADYLGEEVIDWMCERLELNVTSTDEGLDFTPEID